MLAAVQYQNQPCENSLDDAYCSVRRESDGDCDLLPWLSVRVSRRSETPRVARRRKTPCSGRDRTAAFATSANGDKVERFVALLGKGRANFLGAQASLPAYFGQSVIAGNSAGKDACAPRRRSQEVCPTLAP